jgi:hypothetical protein
MHHLRSDGRLFEMICGWCTDGLQAGTKTAVERTLQAMATTGGGAGFGGDMASVPSLSSASLLLCSSTLPLLICSFHFHDRLFGSVLS